MGGSGAQLGPPHTPDNVVQALQCRQLGAGPAGSEAQWACTASLPPEFMLGSTDVVCEGYASAHDQEYVLRGSCAVEYRLLLTDAGEARFWRGRGAEYGDGAGEGDSQRFVHVAATWLFRIVFWTLFAGVAVLMMRSLLQSLLARRDPRDGVDRRAAGGPGGFFPGGGGGGGGGDDDDDDAPPPYDSGTDSKPPAPWWPNTNPGWRPGFWSGAAAGAAAGALGRYVTERAGSRTAGARRGDVGDDGRSGRRGSDWASGSGSPWASGSGSTSQSTGFGGTTMR